MTQRPTESRRLSRRALIASLGASGATLLVLAAAGCQPAGSATPAPAVQPTEAAELPAATAAASPTDGLVTPGAKVYQPEQTAVPPVGSAPTGTAPAASLAPAPPAAPTATQSAVSAGGERTPTPTASTLSQLTPASAAANSTPAKVSGVADLVVVRGPNAEDITRAAVEAIGGIGKYVPKGSTVVVKPNICTSAAPEYAVCTNPEVVAALVKLAREAGASRVKVLDYGWGGQRTSYEESGIKAAVEAAGGEMVAITPLKWKKTDLPKAKISKTQEIYEDVLTADVLINVPIAKDHGLSRLTLGMKNLMGVVRYREPYHGNLGQNLSDLATVVKPAFTLVDAVRILTRNGPQGGSLDYVKRLDTVVASTDIVAADAYSSTLFGLKPDDLETVRAGQANGLGTADLSKLQVAEVKRG